MAVMVGQWQNLLMTIKVKLVLNPSETNGGNTSSWPELSLLL